MKEQRYPNRVYLLGMMGSGKSYWSNKLGWALGVPHYDLDRLIEEKEGMMVRDIFEKKGEEYFRHLESETLKAGVPADSYVLATGGGTPCFFDNLAFMKENGMTVWINPSITELIHRVKKSPGTRPVLANAITDADLYEQLEGLLEKRRVWYNQAALVMDEDDFDLNDLLAKMAVG